MGVGAGNAQGRADVSVFERALLKCIVGEFGVHFESEVGFYT